jgi:hypothetical protein
MTGRKVRKCCATSQDFSTFLADRVAFTERVGSHGVLDRVIDA